MFVLVNNFKMIGMLLNVVHGEVQKSWQKPITKGFPTIPLINYVGTKPFNTHKNLTFNSSKQSKKLS